MSATVLAVATVAGAAIAAGGSMIAANQQAKAAENAATTQHNMFEQQIQNESPYMSAGAGAQGQLNYLLGIGSPGTPASGSGTGGTPGTATSSPGGAYGSLLSPFTASMMQQYSPAYQFQLQQGEQGTLNQDATGSGALSGAAQKDLMSYNQNYANTAFANAFGIYNTQQNNIYNRLAGIASQGEAAASNQTTGGSQYSAGIAQSQQNIGTAYGAGYAGAAGSLASGVSGYGAAQALPWLMAGQQTDPNAIDYSQRVTPSGYQAYTPGTANDPSYAEEQSYLGGLS